MTRPHCAADFDYEYPPESIAQHPLPDRSASRLLALDRHDGSTQHLRFIEFPTLLQPGDVLVLNTSRVIPARLIGTRENGRPAEVLIVHPEPDGSWLAMVHPGGKLKKGRTLRFGDDGVAEIVGVVGGGFRKIRFRSGADVSGIMQRHGSVPLPPYIRRAPELSDHERYQTVYAHTDGSVAAPTAGLHFTTDSLKAVEQRGVHIAEIVLHVGPGTFKPVHVEDLSQHEMHAEWFTIPEETVQMITKAKSRGSRVWAVGTTVTRALESAAAGGPISAGAGWTDLFIFPPYAFKVVDALLTNFHLPRSTLLMLVAALAGREPVLRAYREAVATGYRLFSYGDAMVIR